MTSKRSRFKRRKKLLVAPGREPDEIDYFIVALRNNTTILESPLNCRRCHQPKRREDFAPSERRKQRPLCLACALAPLPVGQPLAPIEPEKPPISRHAAYRKAVAAAELDAEYDHAMKLLMEEERVAKKQD